jgi:hypothetical protein
MGGMETRKTSKFDGTSAIRGIGFPLLESCRVEGKLLVTSKIIKIT